MSHSNSEDSPALAWGVVKSMELNTAAKESAVCRTFSASVSHAQQRPSSVVGNGLTRGPGGRSPGLAKSLPVFHLGTETSGSHSRNIPVISVSRHFGHDIRRGSGARLRKPSRHHQSLSRGPGAILRRSCRVPAPALFGFQLRTWRRPGYLDPRGPRSRSICFYLRPLNRP